MRRGIIATVAVVALVVGVAAGAATTARFSDIEDHWAKPYIEWAADKGIMSGKADGTFRPNEKVTRGQLASYLYRFDQHISANTLTIAQQRELMYVVAYEDGDGEWSFTSDGFDAAYTWGEVAKLVGSLCDAMGNAPANGTLRELQAVIPDWLESVKWKKAATDNDKWRVVLFGYTAVCFEYDTVYVAWSDAGWPGLDLF